MISRLFLAVFCVMLLGLALVDTAQGAEAPSHPFLFEISEFEPEPIRHPHKVEDLEGPCGLALDSQGDIYVANYYHDEVDVFSPSGNYINRMLKEEPTDGPCGLAVDASGDLFVNNLHRNILRFTLPQFPPVSFPETGIVTGPATTIDTQHSTGVALDPVTGDLYVDDRTYVAEYEPSGALLRTIGLGSLEDGYGVAVSGFPATKGFLYVPDAATATVKVYDPAVSQAEPVAEIDGAGTPQHGFASLVDAAAAVDDSNGHVFVTDNLQSVDYEHPRAALDEFNPEGDYRGQLPKIPIFFESEPSGVVVDNSGGAGQGDVYVTSGNSELAKVYAFGPTGSAYSLTVTKSGAGSGTVTSDPAGIDCGGACSAEFTEGAEVALTATPSSGSAFVRWTGACAGSGACEVTMSEARSVSAEFEVAPLSARTQPNAASAPSVVASASSSPAGESTGLSARGSRTLSSTRHRPHHHHARPHSSRHRHR